MSPISKATAMVLAELRDLNTTFNSTCHITIKLDPVKLQPLSINIRHTDNSSEASELCDPVTIDLSSPSFGVKANLHAAMEGVKCSAMLEKHLLDIYVNDTTLSRKESAELVFSFSGPTFFRPFNVISYALALDGQCVENVVYNYGLETNDYQIRTLVIEDVTIAGVISKRVNAITQTINRWVDTRYAYLEVINTHLASTTMAIYRMSFILKEVPFTVNAALSCVVSVGPDSLSTVCDIARSNSLQELELLSEPARYADIYRYVSRALQNHTGQNQLVTHCYTRE